ncbi:MAG: hypothetical protein ACRCYZ_02665 [Alphaproteobacteria bacterium]
MAQANEVEKAPPVTSSIFLTPEEISRALSPQPELKAVLQKKETKRLKTLTLDAILFQNQQIWTLWLNGIRISHETRQKTQTLFPGLRLLKVEENCITVSICQSDESKQTIKLFPGKKYLLP